MKHLKLVAMVLFAVFAMTSCTQDSEILTEDTTVNLSGSLGFCDDNTTINYVSGPQMRSRVEFNYDSVYTGGNPPALVNTTFQWRPTGQLMPITLAGDPFVQGDTGILQVFSSAQVNGYTDFGDWRVKIENCAYSAWISYP